MSNSSPHPHDSLVRHVFSDPENAKGELQHLLPAELSAQLNWSTLKLEPGAFVDEDLQASYSDLLFSVECQGKPAYLYFLLEHQTRPERFFLFRELNPDWSRGLRARGSKPALQRPYLRTQALGVREYACGLPCGGAAFSLRVGPFAQSPHDQSGLKYIVRILDKWLRENPTATHLPIVIPLLLCHGRKPWTYPLRSKQNG